MRTLFAAILSSILMLAAPALAFDIKLGGKFGVGGDFGGTANWSGAEGFAGSLQFGNAWAESANDTYGISESNFTSGYDTGNNSFRLHGGTMTASGSLSTATVSSVGNGFGAAAAGGAGFGAGLSGGAGLVGSAGFNIGN